MRTRRRTAMALWLTAALILGSVAWAGQLIAGLYVATDPPGASVYVDGQLRGVSPCGIPDVAAGQVEIKAELQGFGAVTETVEVEGGKTARVQLTLRPLTNVGSVAVLVEPPGSAVAVDRIPAGRTPVVVPNVGTGTHRVEVSREGHRALHATITVATGQQAVVEGRRGRLLDQLLVAALESAITLAEVHQVAVSIADDLNLDVPGPFDVLFDVKVAALEGTLRFLLRLFDCREQVGSVLYDFHNLVELFSDIRLGR